MANHRRVSFLLLAIPLFWFAAGCSSSNNSSTGGGNPNLQLSPLSAATIELNSSGSASLSVSANQSVTWTVQAGGLGPPPAGASVNPITGNSTTLTFAGAYLPCSGSATTIPVEVVATTSSNPPQTAILPVQIVQSPPCLPAQPVVDGTNVYTTCPPAGTLLTSILGAPQPFGQLTEAGIYTQFQISAGDFLGTKTPFGAPPFTWNLTGTLPAGLTMAPSSDTTSVTISGTPTAVGCASFQLQLTDAVGGVSCNPSITASCVPTSFNIVVVPAALKIQTPVYSFSFDGVPYPPVSLQATGGVAPYSWFPDPSNNSTLPPGLTLASSGSNSVFAQISGTPENGDSNGYNPIGSPTPGQYPTLVYVNDSQTPYPALGTSTLKIQDYLPAPGCSSSTSSPISLLPTGPALNGGVLTAGSVLVDNYLQGQYAFLLRGFDAGQPVVIAGSMNLDGNGNVTSGVEDITKGTSSSPDLPITSGTYTVGLNSPNPGTATSYNRGCASVTTSAGTISFTFSLGGCSNHYSEGGALALSDNACGMSQNGQGINQAAGFFTTGHVIESDNGSGHAGQISGIIRAQTSSAFSTGLSGPYAFGLSGWDSSSGHYSIAGSAQASSGALSSAAADIDDAGSVSSALTGGSGTLATVDANGRIAGTLTVGTASFDLAFYVVSTTEAIVVTTDALTAAHPVLGGEALTTASSFTPASIQNANILAMGGLASSGPDVSLGLLTFDGVGSITGTIYEDQAGTLSTTPVSGGYSVDPSSGRAALSAPQLGQTLGAHSFVAYLIPPSPTLTHANCTVPAACITGFVVGSDSTAQDGVLEYQTPTIAPPPPFTNRFVVGDFVYGTVENLDGMSTSLEGDVFATPASSNTTSGTLGTAQNAFFQDASYGCLQSICPVFIPENTFSGAYSVNTNGTGTFGSASVVSITNGNTSYYIDESPTNTHPAIVVVEQ